MYKKYVLGLVILIAIILAGCSSQNPQIQLPLDSFEFGDVVNGMIVTKDIVVENKGSAPLVIEDVITSCGCTTGEVTPSTIAPDEQGVLHITFDSGAHGPDLTGQLMRQVYLITNDQDNPEVMVEFTANVVKE